MQTYVHERRVDEQDIDADPRIHAERVQQRRLGVRDLNVTGARDGGASALATISATKYLPKKYLEQYPNRKTGRSISLSSILSTYVVGLEVLLSTALQGHVEALVVEGVVDEIASLRDRRRNLDALNLRSEPNRSEPNRSAPSSVSNTRQRPTEARTSYLSSSAWDGMLVWYE